MIDRPEELHARGGPAWILPVMLAIALVACALLIPRREEAGRTPIAPMRLRLMTFNLRWDGFEDGKNDWAHRRDIVYRVLRAFEPDSVGTQEPMKRQIADIETALPALSSYRFDNDPKYTRTQQILYRRDRFERVGAGGFLVAEGTNEHGTVRYCTWVRLRERSTRRCYYHYNVHLDHRDAGSRRASVVRLMRHVAAREHDDPFVVTGDFNTGERSPEMAFLRGERPLADERGRSYGNPIPLVDTFRVLYPNAREVGTGSGFRGRRGGSKIDHVYVAAGSAEVLEAAIVHTNERGLFPSDHFPVTAVIEWKERATP